jgi:hypothetical protein
MIALETSSVFTASVRLRYLPAGVLRFRLAGGTKWAVPAKTPTRL